MAKSSVNTLLQISWTCAPEKMKVSQYLLKLRQRPGGVLFVTHDMHRSSELHNLEQRTESLDETETLKILTKHFQQNGAMNL